MYDMPLMQRLRLDTLVTVVDCSSFLDYIKSPRVANAEESPELFYRYNADKIDNAEEEDDFWIDMPILPDAQGGVCELLIEQTEVADVILLNKIDLASGRISQVKEIIAALNPRAKVIATSFGKIQRLNEILAYSGGNGVAIDGVVDDHKDYVKAVDANNICSDPECTNPSHNHDHSSHSHHDSHSHSDERTSVCNDPSCEDHSHSHFHHSKETSSICNDPNCNDHSHCHTHESSTAHAGIGSFVYRARRPFHPARISSLIRRLPVVRGVPDIEGEGIELPKSTINAFQKVLRSKGFSWMADSNVKALYWSHAGTSFEMQCLGRWWSTLPRNQVC
jgi:G3E family GTPase